MKKDKMCVLLTILLSFCIKSSTFILQEDVLMNDGKNPLGQTPLSALPQQTPGTEYQ